MNKQKNVTNETLTLIEGEEIVPRDMVWVTDRSLSGYIGVHLPESYLVCSRDGVNAPGSVGEFPDCFENPDPKDLPYSIENWESTHANQSQNRPSLLTKGDVGDIKQSKGV